MRRSTTLAAASVLCCSLAAQKQELPAMEELRAPASPAFTLLGVTPTAIERPSTPRALATSLLSAIGDGDGDLASNLAIDVAPYWLVSRPDLSFEEYYGAGLGQTILQTASLSVATTEIPAPMGSTTSPGTRLGVGLRFNLLSGDAAPGLADAVQALRGAQHKLLEAIPDEGEVDENDPKVRAAMTQVRKHGDAIRNMDKQRVGWACDLAGAVALDFLDEGSSDGRVSRAGAWITPSYTPTDGETASWTFLAVGRYLYEDLGGTSSNMGDVGARVVWKSDDLPLALSAEYLHRYVESGPDTHRAAGLLEYQVDETISIAASFGKDFDSVFPAADGVFVLFGVTLGFGKGPVVK